MIELLKMIQKHHVTLTVEHTDKEPNSVKLVLRKGNYMAERIVSIDELEWLYSDRVVEILYEYIDDFLGELLKEV